MFNDKALIFLATPIYDGQRTDFEETCLLKMLQYPTKHYKVIENKLYKGSALISGMRRHIMYDFFKSKATHLFFIDADTAPLQVNALEKLVLDDKDYVGAVVVTRKLPLGILYAPYKGDETDLKRLENGELFEVETTGLPFNLITRRCLQDVEDYAKMQGDTAFQPMMYKDEYEGEDGSFCRRALACNYKIWIDASILVGHVGRYPFSKLDYIDYFKNSKHGVVKK